MIPVCIRIEVEPERIDRRIDAIHKQDFGMSKEHAGIRLKPHIHQVVSPALRTGKTRANNRHAY